MKNVPNKLKNYFKKRTKASSLFLAIIVSFMITVNLSAIFLLSVYQRQYAADNLKVKKLVHNIDEGITFVIQNYDQFEYNKSYEVDLFGDQTDSVSIVKHYWGWYDRVDLRSIDALDSLHKTILIGNAAVPKQQRTAIYVAGRLELININNDSYIKGNLSLPFKGYKSKAGLGVPSLPKLPAALSTSQLPAIREDRIQEFSTILKHITTNISVAEGFLKKRNPVASENIIDCSNKQVPSEIVMPTVLYSSKTLIINQNYSFKNVVIYAPSVVIKSGFTGDVQIFCTDSILVEDNCILNYPSTLTLIKQTNDAPKSIKIGQHCMVDGAVIAIDEAVGFERCYIRIGKESIIHGIIYNMGMLENHAKIYGTIMTNEVTDGTLINDFGTIWIDAIAIPEIYGEPILFLANKKYEFIK